MVQETRQGNYKIMDIYPVGVNARDIVQEVIAHQIFDAVFNDPTALIFCEDFSCAKTGESGTKAS